MQPESLAGSMPTMMGTALGTPQYMSPEQAVGRLDLVGPASDIYSLGATLYFVLTGLPPFQDTDLATILQNVPIGRFPPPRSINKSVPAALDAICLKAMALKIDDRYASARALAVLLLAAAGILGARPALAAPTAQQVEAVFLFYFSQFVGWPPSAFPGPQSPIVIGVLGNDPFGGALDEAVAGERVNGRPVVVQRLRSVDEASGCQILYISSSEAAQLPQILGALKGHNILTVSDAGRFAQSGGMIRFVLIDSHVRLRINAHAAQAAGLTLSSKLLRVAEPAASGD